VTVARGSHSRILPALTRRVMEFSRSLGAWERAPPIAPSVRPAARALARDHREVDGVQARHRSRPQNLAAIEARKISTRRRIISRCDRSWNRVGAVWHPKWFSHPVAKHSPVLAHQGLVADKGIAMNPLGLTTSREEGRIEKKCAKSTHTQESKIEQGSCAVFPRLLASLR
jgi:hypothetical protein